MKKKRPPIGISDFAELRKSDFYYVDKTSFIEKTISAAAKVILLPRPRRFGKTLNLSMLKCFFDINGENSASLFKGLRVENSRYFQAHQGKYPVVHITLKDVKETSLEQCLTHLANLIRDEFSKHRKLMDGNLLYPEEKKRFQSILDGEASLTDHGGALKYLSEYLHRFYGKPTVVLIDEYDTPIHAGYQYGYCEEIVAFLRNFLSGGLKDNTHLFKGVLTGVLRVAKESIFSGLNNLGVYTILDKKFSDDFGFTEPEVAELLEYCDLNALSVAERWYNGYCFGGTTIYNPWSVLNFVDNEGKPGLYWINTGETSMLERLATRGGKEIREEIGRLLERVAIQRPVYENIVMRDLDSRDDLLWSFLLFSGYLKTAGDAVHRNNYPLAIPNEEIKVAYEELVIRWFSRKVESNCLIDMLQALSEGDMDLFELLLRKIVAQIMSYHDLGETPEKVYHAFVLGMLVWMADRYEIRSNRESGYGRYDIMLKPASKEGLGIVMEFKLVEKKGPDAHERTIKAALEQIKRRGYATELKAAGISDILEIAVAFKGKKLWVGYRKK